MIPLRTPNVEVAEPRLRGIRVCVFDAYGTLFDVSSATASSLHELGANAAALNRIWRDKQLQYTWLRAAQGRHADFWQVTRDALDFAFETLRIEDAGLGDRLMQSYMRLTAYPEAAAVLGRLHEAGMSLAILSNGTPQMLHSAVQHAGLDNLFSAVLSVEEAGAYKPDPRVYRLAVDRFGVAADEIAFVSANAWDAHAASASGLRVIWCNRFGARPERLPGKPDVILPSLAGLPSCFMKEV